MAILSHRPSSAPPGAERARGLHSAGILDMAMGADGRLFGVAAPHRRAGAEGAFDAGGFAATSSGLIALSQGEELKGTRGVSSCNPGAFDVEYGWRKRNAKSDG